MNETLDPFDILRFGANKVFPWLVGCTTDKFPELYVIPSVLRGMYKYQIKAHCHSSNDQFKLIMGWRMENY